MAEPTLFDTGPYKVETQEPQKLTADQRRIKRQFDLLAAGLHPLSYYAPFGRLKLHPDAAPADDRTASGLRCGTCRHRQLMSGYHEGRFPKCTLLSTSNAASSDCRAWWPACERHEPREEAS